MTTRRTFVATLALGLLATPRVGRTQPPRRTARVGWIAASPGQPSPMDRWKLEAMGKPLSGLSTSYARPPRLPLT